MENSQLIKKAIKYVEDCLSDISFIKLIKSNASLNDLNADYTIDIETPLGGGKNYMLKSKRTDSLDMLVL